MSASLVGSEMCIRDSLRSLAKRVAAGPPRRHTDPLDRGWAGRTARARPCLLYTSDAADDM
eukprot:14873718-Alexandrium_andersonii.AAC.1